MDFNWTFRNYYNWLFQQEFQMSNPKLSNLKIIPGNYKFVVQSPFGNNHPFENKKDSFQINICKQYNHLWWLIQCISGEICKYYSRFPKYKNELTLDKFVKLTETTFEIILK